MFESELFINGTFHNASGYKQFDCMNPVTGVIASRNAAASLEDVAVVVESAQSAFFEWSETGPTERRKLLLLAADVLESRCDEFIARGVAEIGGSPDWYGFNVMLAANMLREAASLTTQIAGEVIPSDMPGNFSMTVRQPAGVVLGIAPWNAPIILGIRAIATPLACGNTVILKASETCPALHSIIGSVFQEAGFPKGVVNVIANAPDDAPSIVETLIAHPNVRRISFTGSTEIGRIVGQLAARYLKPAVLELGGRNPIVVLDDADLDAAVAAAAFSSYFNQGQICMSADSIIVHIDVVDAFLDKFIAKVDTLRADKPGTEGAELASMVDAQSALRVKGLIEDAIQKGATLLSVKESELNGSILQPSVVDHVTPDMRICQEESFGPVVTIQRAKNDDEAIKLANSSEFGLTASVFSSNISRAMSVAKRIESGMCHINGPTVHDEAQMPFGGMKNSGYGRFGGKAGIDAFTELRWLSIQGNPPLYPI